MIGVSPEAEELLARPVFEVSAPGRNLRLELRRARQRRTVKLSMAVVPLTEGSLEQVVALLHGVPISLEPSDRLVRSVVHGSDEPYGYAVRHGDHAILFEDRLVCDLLTAQHDYLRCPRLSRLYLFRVASKGHRCAFAQYESGAIARHQTEALGERDVHGLIAGLIGVDLGSSPETFANLSVLEVHSRWG